MQRIRIGEHDSIDSLDGFGEVNEFGSLRKSLKKITKKIKRVSPLAKLKKATKKLSPVRKLLGRGKKKSSSSAQEVVYEEAPAQEETFYAETEPVYSEGGYSSSAPSADEYAAYDEGGYPEEEIPEVNPTETADDEDDEDDDEDELPSAARSLTQDPAATSPTAPGAQASKIGPLLVVGGIAVVGIAAYFLFFKKK